jgi:hypothetical protein
VAAAGGGPVVLSEDQIASLADELGHPVYWAGEQSDAELEVTRSRDDQVYVRYLTGGAEAGEPGGQLLTVGTYPFENATATLEELAQRKGALTNTTPDGALVVTNQDNPTSVYLAYPGEDLQIEVYDPDPERAFSLATSGEITPVE